MIQEREAELAQIKQQRDSLLESANTPLPTPEPPKPKPAPVTFALTDQDADNVETVAKASHAGFGTSFPLNPEKGDMFLRVDMLPNKLFKWNGKKWIEIAKSSTDRYAYEEEYIKYITTKIVSGEYDMDDLSKSEQEEVLRNLTYDQKRRL